MRGKTVRELGLGELLRENAAAYIVALLMIFALLWLSRAAGDKVLSILLWPQANAVGLFYNMRLSYLPGVGYCASGCAFTIAKECLGAGFTAMLLGLLTFGYLHRFAGWRKALWLWLSLLAAAVIGVAVNCIRVVGSLPLVSMEKFATLHTAAGAVLYFASLIGVYLVVRKLTGGIPNGKED